MPTEHPLVETARALGLVREGEGLEIREEPVEQSGYPPWRVVLVHSHAQGQHERVIFKRLAEVSALDLVGAWRDHSICCG